MTQNTHRHKPILVQAPVRALDPDGVAVVTSGTIAFAVAAGICWTQYDALRSNDDGWWLWVSVAGTLIGAVGLAFSLVRRSRRRPVAGTDDATG